MPLNPTAGLPPNIDLLQNVLPYLNARSGWSPAITVSPNGGPGGDGGDFGPNTPGTTTAGWQEAETYLYNMGGGTIFAIKATYNITGQLVFYSGVTIFGNGATIVSSHGGSAFITNANAIFYRTSIRDMTLDGGGVASQILTITSAQRSEFYNIMVQNGSNGILITANAALTGPESILNATTTFCRFGFHANNITGIGLTLYGLSATNPVTDCDFYFVLFENIGGTGFYAQQWCDSNKIGRMEIGLYAANAIGAAFGSSTNGVYNYAVDQLTVDNYFVANTGCIGLQLNGSQGIIIQAFFISPTVANFSAAFQNNSSYNYSIHGLGADSSLYVNYNDGQASAWGASSPAVPASGVYAPNNSEETMEIFITGIGGGVSAYAIKDEFGTIETFTPAAGLAQGFLCRLYSRQGLALTYGGAAPTWKWKGCNG